MDGTGWDGTTDTTGSDSTPGETTTTGRGSPSAPSTTGTPEPPDSTASPSALDTTGSTSGSWPAPLGVARTVAGTVLRTLAAGVGVATGLVTIAAQWVDPPPRYPLWPQDDDS